MSADTHRAKATAFLRRLDVSDLDTHASLTLDGKQIATIGHVRTAEKIIEAVRAVCEAPPHG